MKESKKEGFFAITIFTVILLLGFFSNSNSSSPFSGHLIYDTATGASIFVSSDNSYQSPSTDSGYSSQTVSEPQYGNTLSSSDVIQRAASVSSASVYVYATPQGTGSGSVSSSPSGINTGNAQYGADFVSGSTITFTATPWSDSVFAGWQGCTSSGEKTCIATVSGTSLRIIGTFNSASATTYKIIVSAPTSGKVESTSVYAAAGGYVPDAYTISCSSSSSKCSETYMKGTQVRLTATPDAGATFVAWTGACASQTSSTCELTLTSDASVGATFTTKKMVYVYVSPKGTGSGSVSSSPSGINTGNAQYGANFESGSTVAFTATPYSGSTLSSWSGCTSSSGNICTVTVSGTSLRIIPTFNSASATTYKITVSTPTSGKVESTSVYAAAGGYVPDAYTISCSSSSSKCSETYMKGTQVRLTATPDAGATFVAWTGACASQTSSTCELTLTSDASVGATFTTKKMVYVYASPKGTGSGSVSSSPSGINTGNAQYGINFEEGSTVTFTATPYSGSTLSSWSGCTSSSGNICTVSVKGTSMAIEPTFAIAQTQTTQTQTYSLTLTKTSTGSGTITSSDAKINCGSTCSTSYSSKSTVTLTATAASGSTFSGWSGACSGTQSTCTVSVDDAKTVSAGFKTSGVQRRGWRRGWGSGVYG